MNLNDVLGAIGGVLQGQGTQSSAGMSAGYASLISTALDFGVSYLVSKSEGKKNEDLLRRMSELDAQQAEKLKALIKDSANEITKTKVIFDFLAKEDAKKLELKRKKERILPIIVLGFSIVILGVVFYKLQNRNNNG